MKDAVLYDYNRIYNLTKPGGIYPYKECSDITTMESAKGCNTRGFACRLAWGSNKSFGDRAATASALRCITKMHNQIVNKY